MEGPIEQIIELLIESAAFERMGEIAKAPLTYPEIIPTILPLVIGFVILELYFGKYSHEELDWTAALINSLLWIKISLSLIWTETLETYPERYLTYSLLLLGLFTAYMNFNHVWRKKIAFVVSSEFMAYTYAYLIVILVKTDIVVDIVTLKASLLFLLMIFILITFVKLTERVIIEKKSENYFS